MYRLGKLLAEWLVARLTGGKEECQVLSSQGDKMQKDRTPAAHMLEDICKFAG